jgi:hypothetical protein
MEEAPSDLLQDVSDMSNSGCEIADFQICNRFVRQNLIFTPSPLIEVKFPNRSNGLVRSVARRAGFRVEQN